MKSAAVLTIKKPGALSYKARLDIARWIWKQAANLLKHGNTYVAASNYRASFSYLEKK